MGLGSQGFTPLIRERYRERQTAAPRYSRVRGMRDRTKGRLSLIWLLAERALPAGIQVLDRLRDTPGRGTGEYPNFLRIFLFFWLVGPDGFLKNSIFLICLHPIDTIPTTIQVSMPAAPLSSPVHSRVMARGLRRFPVPAPALLPVGLLPGVLRFDTVEFCDDLQRVVHLL